MPRVSGSISPAGAQLNGTLTQSADGVSGTAQWVDTNIPNKTGAFTLTAKEVSGKLTGPQSLALARGLRDRYEKAYQHKDAAADMLRQQAMAEARKIAKNYPKLAAEGKELLFDLKYLSVGRKAMEIKAEDLDGKEFKLSDYRGKVVVLDFWGNW